MNQSVENIEQLLTLCMQGDTVAQMKIYDRYYMAMYNTSYRIVKDGFEAEDIMQESFLSAFTKLHTFKKDVTFGAWLKRIVINNSIYSYKKKQRYKEESLDTVMYKVEDNAMLDISNDVTKEKVKRILKIMETLKDNYRISLTLHLIEGYDYEEVAQIMQIGYANCRTLISRAKECLRKKLQLNKVADHE